MASRSTNTPYQGRELTGKVRHTILFGEPVVIAAIEAILDPAFNLRGVQTTDENVTPLIVINGPLGLLEAIFATGRKGVFSSNSGGSCVMPGMVELGEDIFLKPVRRGLPKYAGGLADMVSQPRAATVMGLLEEARLARLRGYKVTQKKSSVNNAFGRFKDFIVGNF